MKLLKNILLLLSFFLLLNTASSAQDSLKGSSPVRHIGLPNPLPVLPRFPGGKDSLAAFIKRNMRYPEKALKHHISGEVEVYFIVMADGTIKNPKISKSLGYGCDEEAIRIVHLMPKWTPATKGREPMELNAHVTISFGKQE